MKAKGIMADTGFEQEVDPQGQSNNRDITERKRLETELRGYRERLEELVRERTAELVAVNEALSAEITERKQLERALLASGQFLQSTLDSLQEQIAILDQSGTIVAVNASWRHFADENGLVWPDYGLGRNYLAVLDSAAGNGAQGSAEAAVGIRALLAGERDRFSLEYPCHSPAKKRWCVMRLTRFQSDEGIRIVSAHQEITERVQAEAARTRLAAIVESSDDAIIGKDLDGIIFSWNRGAETLYGYSAEEAIGQSISMLLLPERQDEVAAILDRLERGEHIDHFETERLTKGGQHIYVSLNVSPILDETGRVAGASTIARNITARIEAQQALREAKEAAEVARHEEEKRREEAERRRRIAEGLGDILTILNSNLSLDQVLDYIALQAGTLLGTRAAGICRLEKDGGELTVQALQGLLLTYSGGMVIPIGQEALREAMALRRPVVISDLSQTLPREGKTASSAGRSSAAGAWARIYRALLAVPIVVQNEIYGGMLLYYGWPRTFSDEEVDLAILFADQVALAIENAWLRDQVRVAAASAERDRLARDLHDAVTQTLFSASLIAEAMPRVWEQDPDQGRRGLEELRRLTRGAAAEMRTLLLELRPAALTEKPLGELLRHLTEAMTSRTRLPIALSVDGDGLLREDVQIALYRIAQESLNNVAKHASASRVAVDLSVAPGHALLRIQDDGPGFDPGDNLPDQFGVRIMRERAAEVSAVLEIDSRAGGGTEVVVHWQDGEGGR